MPDCNRRRTLGYRRTSSAVAEVVVKNKPVRVEMVGQKDTFGESGKPAELREKYGLTKADIVKAVKNVIA